jgi:uncharacterized membrane protein
MKQPKIEIEWTPFDWLFEGLALAGLLVLLVLPMAYYSELPDIIPQHFNARGEADGFGSKMMLWILPGIGAALYIFMSVLSRRPHLFNYNFKITPENAERQYRLAIQLVRILKVMVMSLFAYLVWGTIQVAISPTKTLDGWLLWFMLGANATLLFWYFISASRKK